MNKDSDLAFTEMCEVRNVFNISVQLLPDCEITCC